jgi:hypothetical protein
MRFLNDRYPVVPVAAGGLDAWISLRQPPFWLDATPTGNTNEFTAPDMTLGAIVLGAPTVGQTHVLTAPGLVWSAPTLGAPTVGQTHVLTAAGLTTGAPVLGAPTLGQVHQLTAAEPDWTRYNLVTNPSVEIDTTGYGSSGDGSGSTGSIARDTSDAFYGSACLRLTKTNDLGYYYVPFFAGGALVVPGKWYLLRIHYKVVDVQGDLGLRFGFGSIQSWGAATYVNTTPVVGDWQEFTCRLMAPAGTTSLRAIVVIGGGFGGFTGGSGAVLLDGLQISPSPAEGEPAYIDGDQPGCVWDGTPHDSQSSYPLTPVLGAPMVGQAHQLTAADITATAPVLDTPAIGQVHALFAATLVGAAPLSGAPQVGQVHHLVATDLLSRRIVLGAPLPLTGGSLGAQRLLLGVGH